MYKYKFPLPLHKDINKTPWRVKWDWIVTQEPPWWKTFYPLITVRFKILMGLENKLPIFHSVVKRQSFFPSAMGRAWYQNHRMGLSLSISLCVLMLAELALCSIFFAQTLARSSCWREYFALARLLPMLVRSLGMHTFMQSAIVWRLPAGVIISLQGNKFVCKRWNGARQARESHLRNATIFLLKFPRWFNIVIQSTAACNLIVPAIVAHECCWRPHCLSHMLQPFFCNSLDAKWLKTRCTSKLLTSFSLKQVIFHSSMRNPLDCARFLSRERVHVPCMVDYWVNLFIKAGLI